MEQYEQSMEETILQLYESLHDPCVEDPNLIGNQLIEIYSNREFNVIPILFDIFSNHPKITFRKQASIGLRICIKECFNQFDEDSIQQIWNVFFHVFLSEQNDELIQLLVNPAVDLFIQIQIHYQLGFESFGIFVFFQSLAEANFVRCLQILAVFLRESKSSIKIEKDFYEFILHLLKISFQYLEKHYIIKEILFISNFLISSDQIEDNIKDEISNQLSQLFIDLLTDIDEYKFNQIVQFYSILEDDIQPLKMEMVSGPIFQVLFNQEIEIKYRYHIAFLFSLILKTDDTKFNLEDIILLFKFSIHISVLLFDISDDQSDPDSVVMSDLILECLLRIPNNEVQNIVIETFQCLIGQEENADDFDFGSASLFAKLITALLLVQSAIMRSAYLFIDFIPHIADFCVECFEANNIAIQNISSKLFTDHITLFASHILPKIPEIAESILTKIDKFEVFLNKPDSYDYDSGFEILQSILHQFPTDICDQLFDPIFSECTKIIDSIPIKIQMKHSNEYIHHYNIVFESWVLLGELFRNVSEELSNSYYDEIFPVSIDIINTFYETQLHRQEQNYYLLEDTDIQNANVELIGSLAYSCSANLANQFDDVVSLLIELLQFQTQNYLNGNVNDLLLVHSLFNCLGMFVTNMTSLMSQYVDTLLPIVIEIFKSVIETEESNEESQKYATPEMILDKQMYFSDHFSAPAIDFLENVLESMPEKIQNEVMIVDFITISIHSLKSISKNEILSSISLLIQFFKFLAILNKSQDSKDYLEVVKMFIQLIYDKLNEEIENIKSNDDNKILFSWMECIKVIYIYFKADTFIVEGEEEGQERYLIFDIFNSLIDLASSIYQDGDEDKLRYVKDLHDHIESLLIIIIRYYGQEDYSTFVQFIPKILPFLEEENLYFHVFSINILSSIIKESSIIEDELIAQLFERSVKSIIEDDPLFSRYFAFFLSNLRFKYPSFLIENSEKLVNLIDETTSNLDVSKSVNQSFSEYLIALFASIDRCFIDQDELNHLTDLQRFSWFVSKLPIENSLKDNNQIIYGYLISHFVQFPDLKNEVFRLFCMIFISKKAISESFLPREIVHVIYEIIVESKIVDDQETISIIFDENAEVIESFYATMNELFQLFSSV